MRLTNTLEDPPDETLCHDTVTEFLLLAGAATMLSVGMTTLFANKALQQMRQAVRKIT